MQRRQSTLLLLLAIILLEVLIIPPSKAIELNNKGSPTPPGIQHQNQQHLQPQQTTEGGGLIYINLLTYIESYLTPLASQIDSQLFVTQLGGPSEIYKFKDLAAAIPVVYDGIAGSRFYLGESDLDLGWEYGLVNLAAFLAQCMKETIQYDACDENNWDVFNNVYPVANACGQLGQSYEDYNCPAGEEHMQCEVDPEMRIEATTHATWYGAPPGLFCAPKTDYPWVGIWDYNYWCNNPWGDPPEECSEYEGQKAGRFDHSEPVASRSGRTDVEGCCWWGRGVIQTTGLCNFGKLNYFLGARAAAEGRNAKYPDIDFCKTPDKICSSTEHTELKWIAGFFYWMKDVQNYNQDGWYYKTELHKFVNSGMVDNSFIDAVSGIVNRGCHNPPCATGNVDGLLDRRTNFLKVLGVFNLPSAGSRPPSTLPPVPPPPASSPTMPIEPEDSALLNGFLHRLNSRKRVLQQNVFSYETVGGTLVQSDIYTFDSFIESVVYAYVYGHAGMRFYLGPQSTTNTPDLRYGLVNIALFLALSQTESLSNNACEESNTDLVDGEYPISNSCGQLCPTAQKSMECPASTCLSVGALMTKGACMMGKLNYYLGADARDGRPAIFPEIDFCTQPEDICRKVQQYKTIIWDIAFFEWVERIQTHDDGVFNYKNKLHEFVDAGMVDSYSFVTEVSNILSRTENAQKTASTQYYFKRLLEYLQLNDGPPALFVRNSSPRQKIMIGTSLWLLFSVFMLC